MFELKIPITDVTIVRRSGGTDKIFIGTSQEHSELVHAEKLDVFNQAYYHLDVTKGRAEEVCRALGIPDDLVTLVKDT